jgi:hypothetical protein
VLLFRFLASALLGEREAFGLLAARGAFFYVVSALAVSHRTFTLTLSRPISKRFRQNKTTQGYTIRIGRTSLSISMAGFDRVPTAAKITARLPSSLQPAGGNAGLQAWYLFSVAARVSFVSAKGAEFIGSSPRRDSNRISNTQSRRRGTIHSGANLWA